jgi:hypothetical protein
MNNNGTLGIGPGAHGVYFIDPIHREHTIQVRKSNPLK